MLENKFNGTLLNETKKMTELKEEFNIEELTINLN